MGVLAQLQNASRASNPRIGNPLGPESNVNDIGLALNTDETALFGSGTTGAYGDLSLPGLSTPPTPTVTVFGTGGSQTWSYVLVDISNVGSAPSAAGSATTTGNATLSATNYNQISMNVTAGHTYSLYRTVSGGTPSSLGLLTTFTVPLVTPQAVYTYNDVGALVATAKSPAVNTSGGALLSGPLYAQTVFLGGGSSGLGGKVTLDGATGQTLTGLQCFADLLVRTSSSGAINDTLPTAQAIVAAAGPGAKAGSTHRMEYRNEGSGVITIVTGSNVTLRTGNTNTITNAYSRFFTFVLTTVTVGSEAVEVITGVTSAF